MAKFLCCQLRSELIWIWNWVTLNAPPFSTIEEMWEGPAREHAPAVTALRGVGIKVVSISEMIELIYCDH